MKSHLHLYFNRVAFFWMVILLPLAVHGQEMEKQLLLSTFDMDATPPVGTYLAYDPMEKAGELGLRARGIVIQGMGLPVVICAIDWIGIGNESQDYFKATLAASVGTIPERVAIHTVHQHDAPISDFSAERILKDAGLEPYSFEGDHQRDFINKLAGEVKKSLESAQVVTHVGNGKAMVKEVASNRRILGPDGKALHSRTSSTKDPNVRAFPEGLIDPEVSLVSFWNGENPLAVMSYYAVHPQSYYLTKIANPDFPGIARYLRQLEVPEALHIHFNGAGGNVTAGKYNDGAKENRYALAKRLEAGMKEAWLNTEKQAINPTNADWKVTRVSLPVAEQVAQIRSEMAEKDTRWLTNNIQKLAWLERREKGITNPIYCLYLGDTRILHLPGELFVEYQLAAKAFDPSLAVHLAAYGDYGPFYIGTAKAYEEGGYEISTSPTTAEAEPLVLQAIEELLSHQPTASENALLTLAGRNISKISEWEEKRHIMRKNMEEVMGKLPARQNLPSLDMLYLDTLREESFTRYSISFASYKDHRVPAFLYVPHDATTTPAPAILALHSTGDPGKKIVDGQTPMENRAVARELAGRGYVVIAPDYPSFGDLIDHDFDTDGFESGTMLGIWNHMRSVDVLEQLPWVNAEKIGVIGHSLGGHNAMFVGAFDERLKVIVSSCGWTPFDYYNIGEEASKHYGGRLGPWAQDRYMPKIKDHMPEGQLPFDFTDIISLLAPRAFFSNSPLGDGNFDVEGVKKGVSEVHPVYHFLGYPENLQVRFPDAGHDFPLPVRKEAYEFIDRQLGFQPNPGSIP